LAGQQKENSMEVIHSYSRAQAIEDGVLIDVSEAAREAGFKFPVAVTQGVWARCVEVPEGLVDQDESGRLWDVLWMLRHGIVRSNAADASDRIQFCLYVKESEDRPRLVTLWSVCGPGDEGEPVITVMLPDED
jgi:hypothetical protein